MSITVLSGKGISNHLLNHSVSKQMYSFPKSPRFKVLNKSSSATFLYNIPSKFSERKAFIGYGNKSDFTKFQSSNADFYNIKREFDRVDHPYIDFKNYPHYSFGLSKEHMLKRVINGKTSEIKILSPGPGKYNYLKPFGSFSPKYTMGQKFQNKELSGNTISPGPARYNNNLVLNKKGFYSLSNFHNSSLYSIGKEKRFNYNHSNTPAPNQYNLGYLINGSGNIYNSIYRSPTSKTIARKYKSIFDNDNGTPGPGAYTTFSEFGIYRSKYADRNIKRKTKNKSLKDQTFNSFNASLNSTDGFSSMYATSKGIFSGRGKLTKGKKKINLKKIGNDKYMEKNINIIDDNEEKKNKEDFNLEYKEKESVDNKIVINDNKKNNENNDDNNENNDVDKKNTHYNNNNEKNNNNNQNDNNNDNKDKNNGNNEKNDNELKNEKVEGKKNEEKKNEN